MHYFIQSLEQLVVGTKHGKYGAYGVIRQEEEMESVNYGNGITVLHYAIYSLV